VVAMPGYWGAVDVAAGTVAFAVCPGGYCCSSINGSSGSSGSSGGTCAFMDSCAQGRQGPLCGSCAPGHVATLGGPGCAPVGACSGARLAWVWALVVMALLISAALQFTVVSGVWFGSPRLPTGKMKLVIYFLQVGSGVCVRVCGGDLPRVWVDSRGWGVGGEWVGEWVSWGGG
jgi:hypothetical protein